MKHYNVVGLERIVEQLLDNGADINAIASNAMGQSGNSALILAIQSGKYHRNMYELVLRKDPLIKMHIFGQGFEKTAELLIQRGANVGLQGSDGNTALIHAAGKGTKH